MLRAVFLPAVLLRQRMQMLSAAAAAWRAGQRLRFSSMLCLDVAGRRLLNAAAEKGRTGRGLFPEHRYVLQPTTLVLSGCSSSVDLSGLSRFASMHRLLAVVCRLPT